jgi:hypothetical protein
VKVHLKKEGHLLAQCGFSGYGEFSSNLEKVTCERCKRKHISKELKKRRESSFIKKRK